MELSGWLSKNCSLVHWHIIRRAGVNDVVTATITSSTVCTTMTLAIMSANPDLPRMPSADFSDEPSMKRKSENSGSSSLSHDVKCAEFQRFYGLSLCYWTHLCYPISVHWRVIAPAHQLITPGFFLPLPIQLVSICPEETGLASPAHPLQPNLLARLADHASPTRLARLAAPDF